MNKKTLYLLGGPMGVGKSRVGELLKKKLPRAVYLDGDWCWDADPFVVTEETKGMVLKNITTLLQNFLFCSEYENIIFTWVMHEASIIEAVLKPLNLEGVEVKVMTLLATKEELRKRLLKDVHEGLREEDVVTRSLDRLEKAKLLETIHVDTTGLRPKDVVERILEL